MALPNYVKFQRGSEEAWGRLTQKDQNTLYFIYDASDENKGKLYLGNRLIGGIGDGSGATSLSQLTDVLVTGANTGDFLVLNSAGKWTATSAADVAQSILATGGNFVSIDEDQFEFNAINGKLELKGYSTATNGLVPVKTGDGLNWTNLPLDLSTQVGNLESGLNAANTAIAAMQSDLQAVDGKIADAISQANHLSYQIINDLNSATETNVVYLYSNGTALGNNIYDEYMLINSHLERIGSTDIDLSNYATTSAVLALDTRVGTLESDVSSLTTATLALDTRVGALESDVSSLTTATLALDTRVGALESDVSSLTTAVNNLQAITNNFVLVSTFNAVIGTMSAVNSVYNNLNNDDSIANTLIDIYDRLTWQELN